MFSCVYSQLCLGVPCNQRWVYRSGERTVIRGVRNTEGCIWYNEHIRNMFWMFDKQLKILFLCIPWSFKIVGYINLSICINFKVGGQLIFVWFGTLMTICLNIMFSYIFCVISFLVQRFSFDRNLLHDNVSGHIEEICSQMEECLNNCLKLLDLNMDLWSSIIITRILRRTKKLMHWKGWNRCLLDLS